MKMFLASAFDKTATLFLKCLPEMARKERVLFVANAADTHEEKPWVERDRQAFVKMGFEVVDTDLRTLSVREFARLAEEIGLLHVCGGSVLYLNALLKRTDADQTIKRFIRGDKIVYTGTSAGSVVMAPSVELYRYEAGEGKFVADTKDFSGLGLIDVLILPHANRAKHIEDNQNIIKHVPEQSLPVLLLHDNQALWIEDEKMELLSA